jgi:hypothetical protein
VRMAYSSRALLPPMDSLVDAMTAGRAAASRSVFFAANSGAGSGNEHRLLVLCR